MNFDNDEDIMKAINAAGGGGNMDVDDELAALEAEMNGGKKEKKKKKDGDDLSLSDLSDDEEEKKKPAKKHDSDDDLAALENEGLDDIDDEEEKKKPPKKEVKKETPPQAQPQKKPQPQVNKQELQKAMQAKQSQTKSSSPGVDLYPEKVEKKYHSVEKMTSLGVFEEEKALCDKIIEYKKGINLDYDDWEIKKESLADKQGIVLSYINDQIWDFETYKKKIKDQYLWESKLLQFVEKDPSLNDKQKNIIKERVNRRKKIIEDELTRNPEEEADQEEEKEKQKEEAPKQPIKEEKKPVQNNTPKVDSSVDLYPEKAENKYHSVAKMDSVTVIEKEKELCDKIIEYKKKRNEDYDTWEFKKENLDTKNQTITDAVENGIMDLEAYRKKITNQYKWEAKLLQFVEKDPSLNENQKNIIKERVNNRKKIIEEELTTNPEEGGDEKEEPPKQIEEKEKTKETPKKKVELEPKKSLNPMFDVPKEKEQDEIKRLTQVVTDRLNEYRAAIDYFKNNELTEQQTSAIKAAKEICIELKKIQDGKWKEVNEFKLPDPVIPEYIYGYSKEERKQKFNEIIKDYKNQKNNYTKEINAIIEPLQKMNKTTAKKTLPMVKPKLDELKSKSEKIDKIIKLLLQKYQDVWVPAPLYVETEEQKKIKKINQDIPPNQLKIIFGKTTYSKKDRLYLIVKYPKTDSPQQKNQDVTFDQKGPGDWSKTICWDVKDIYKKLHRTQIEVDIYEKKTLLKDKFKGKFEMDMKGLASKNEYNADFKIQLDGKKETPTVNVTFQIRESCKEPEYVYETVTKFQVTRIYPAFNLRGGNNNESSIKLNVEDTKVTSEDLKVSNHPKTQINTNKPTPVQKPQKMAPKTSAPKPKPGGAGAPTKKPGPPKTHIDKSEFSEEELKDPDCINCLNTLQVLEFKLNKYEEIRNKIDGRTPRELMQRIVKIKCKIQNLNDALGEDIGPQDYLALLKTTFSHDKKLADYFNQEKDTEKSKLVSERLPLIIKETEELMKQMPK